jgi:hypothetical protein
MTVCKICSRPIENGKYCKRCKLQKQAKFVEAIEKSGQTIKVIAPIVIPIIITLLGKQKDSSSGDTA